MAPSVGEPRNLTRTTRLFLQVHLTPARLLVYSFLALIGIGTVGLEVLPGLYSGDGLSWVDALFTATSAVCVTGLIVVDTAEYFTRWGQAYILLLVQLGGLGILTFTTLAILALGRRLSLHQEALTGRVREILPDLDVGQIVRSIFLLTFLFEGLGGALLLLLWQARFPWPEALWHAVFQAVSAFCNAGFSTFSDSLVGFRHSPLSLLVIMALVVLGGLGFLTLEELRPPWLRRRSSSPRRLSLHSRLVLTTSAVLLVGGGIFFLGMEWRNTLADMSVVDRITNGMFMSVTARTAGFNTVDYAATSESSDFVTMLLMAAGGSPGSTAGGMKTTTVALLGLLALARLRGHRVTSAWGRTVPEETVQRAVGLFVMAFGVMTLGTLLFSFLEAPPGDHAAVPGMFLAHMFEAVSAFNTVGLSTGVTPELSQASRVLTTGLMFVGRVGPLTFATAVALGRPGPGDEFRYAHEDVVIG